MSARLDQIARRLRSTLARARAPVARAYACAIQGRAHTLSAAIDERGGRRASAGTPRVWQSSRHLEARSTDSAPGGSHVIRPARAREQGSVSTHGAWACEVSARTRVPCTSVSVQRAVPTGEARVGSGGSAGARRRRASAAWAASPPSTAPPCHVDATSTTWRGLGGDVTAAGVEAGIVTQLEARFRRELRATREVVTPDELGLPRLGIRATSRRLDE